MSSAIQMITPLPPARTGIAQYSDDLIRSVAGRWPMTVVADGPSERGPRLRRRSIARITTDSAIPSVLQLGNSEYHPIAYELALKEHGVLVLHDVVVHHGRFAEFVRQGRGGDYRRIVSQRYGPLGADVADMLLRGQSPENLFELPLFEDFVERSALTIVHSSHARDRVLNHVADANVAVVPMGVPLPTLVDQVEARKALGLPESAFIIASVTHVNPYKRLPVVLRALRRVVSRFPEALLVVAGTVAPGIDLAAMAHLYNLDRHLKLLGYVSDEQARLVARAADVCVNLRYPSAGETSASLLRLLGAERPVIVTDDPSMVDYPRDAVLPVPVDRFEDEVIGELLVFLAEQSEVRSTAGRAARAFIEQCHSMQVMIDGYRTAIATGLEITLPTIEAAFQHEPEPCNASPAVARQIVLSDMDEVLVNAVAGVGIADHDGTITAATRAMRDLGLHRNPDSLKGMTSMSSQLPIRQELLDILACPVCKTSVRLEGDRLVCDTCKRRYRIDDGIPVMLADEAE